VNLSAEGFPRRTRAATLSGMDELFDLPPAEPIEKSEVGGRPRLQRPNREQSILRPFDLECPRVYQSGLVDRRGALSKAGPKYLRWALIEAAATAARLPQYRAR
jgi:transposase